MIFFTADTHLGHDNVIAYENRPFQTVDEMDEMLIQNWNRKVAPEDEVFILGDLTLKGPQKANELLARLRGRKYLIRGNHDGYVDRADFQKDHFVWIKDYYELEYREQWFVLCHYPLLSWNGMRQGSFHLHGHQHNRPYYNESNRKMGIKRLDVGVDAQGMAPVSIEELLAFWTQEHHPDEYWGRIKPAELRLELTCGMCPEQYDVFDKDGQYLGYLHFGSTVFTVNCLEPGDGCEKMISSYSPAGWGGFDDEQERAAYLAIARRDIAKYYRELEPDGQEM